MKAHKRASGRSAVHQQTSPHSAFERNLESELKRISRELKAGEYLFSPLEAHFVPNKDGTKERLICVPSIADRVVQRGVMDLLTRTKPKWLVNNISYGFVPGRGVRQAALLAASYRGAAPWVFKTDITKFFDNVDRDLLATAVRRRVRHKSLHAMLDAVSRCEVMPSSRSQLEKINKLGIKTGVGVRQGMPLSPLFANLVLADFDQACIKEKLKVVRYADDLIFFASSENEARLLYAFCTAQLSSLSLEIPALGSGSKTAIHSPSEAAEFLGVELAMTGTGAYQVQVSQKQFHAIKSSIYTLANVDELKNRNITFAEFGNVLTSKISGYSASYEFCANHADLDARLNDWHAATVTKLMESLGVVVAKLSSRQRWFIGL